MQRSTPTWALFLLGVWWILEPGAWLGAVLAVAAGLTLRRYAGVSPRTHFRVAEAARFVPYFIGQSVLGAWDVSRRALAPSLPVSPSLVRHVVRLPSGAPRVFLSSAISLLPGTFAADLRGDELVVHCLADGTGAARRIQAFEGRVARLFAPPNT